MSKCAGKYIYCIIKSPKSFKVQLEGINRERVGLIVSRKLAAVVSDSPAKDYALTRENTTTHLKIIEEIMRVYPPVLPVSFGTVTEDSDAIKKRLLVPKQDEFLRILKNIDGKTELNLKAIWLDKDKISQKIVLENPELQSIQKRFSGRMVTRDIAIEVGRLIADELERKKDNMEGEILSMLKGMFVEYKKLPLLGDQMIVNLAFLISKNKQKSFDDLVKHFDDKYRAEDIYFKYIGPTPLFNFVKLEIPSH
jgi:hypothetical protein